MSEPVADAKLAIHHYPDGSTVMFSTKHHGRFVAVLPDKYILRDQDGITHFESKEEAEDALGEFGHGPRPDPDALGNFGYGQHPDPDDPWLAKLAADVKHFGEHYRPGVKGPWDDPDEDTWPPYEGDGEEGEEPTAP